jgi:protein involved in polysaccharide export with SLBB domain
MTAMLRLTFFVLIFVFFSAAGCGVPQFTETKAPPPVPAASAASAESQAKEAVALAAVMQQVARTKTEYRIGLADLIAVTVYQDPDMNRKVRVNADGTVSLPLVGPVKIGGMTLIEAQTMMEKKLGVYVVSPQVSLFIEDYGNKTVFVMGEVQKPGSYAIPTESRMTLLEAISTAGGFTPIAAQDHTRVLRNVNGVSTTFNVNVHEITRDGQKEKDMILEPNDMVFVPQSFF